jgi:ubiquinone/menaquinone biosynthesis C-methylase UbiE
MRLTPQRPARLWTPDTRFGAWFQNTEIWRRYVVSPALGELAQLLGAAAPRPKLLLDAGCGAGQAFDEIAARFQPERILAVDIDRRQLALARQSAARCACPVDLQHADLRRLDLRSESVDLALCHQVLHHVSDQEAVLAELFRVLRPGGFLLVAESCRAFVRSLPVRLLFRHPRGVQRSADGYRELLRASGFAFERETTSTSEPFWARPDFGLRERFGLPRAASEAPEVQVVARRPALPSLPHGMSV